MTDQIDACPECRSGELYRRGGTNTGGPATDGKTFRCRSCNATFDEPVARPRLREGTLNLSTLAGRLAAAEPEEVSA